MIAHPKGVTPNVSIVVPSEFAWIPDKSFRK